MQEKNWEILKSKYVYKTAYGNLRKDVCKTLRGNKIDYYIWESNDTAIIVALTKDKKVVLQRQYRHPHKRWLWQLPAGTAEDGENIEEMIKRELAEESGYTVEKIIHLDTTLPSLGKMPHKHYIFLGLGAAENAEKKFDPAEDLNTHVVGFDTAFKWMRQGKFEELSMKLAFYLTKEYLKTY